MGREPRVTKNGLTIPQKKELAEILFFGDVKQSVIARTVGATENTISDWVEAGQWRDKRARQKLTRHNALDAVLSMIENQSWLLKNLSDLMVQEVKGKGNEATIADYKAALLGNGQLDGLQKLFTTLKGKELGVDDVTNVCRDLMEYLSTCYPAAKEVMPFIGEFIQSKKV